MERFIWLLTFIPCRIILIILGGLDFYLFASLEKDGFFRNTILSNPNFLMTIGMILLISILAFAIWGGIIGYKYVEMGRSRWWHYRADKYDEFNNQLSNTLYWAVKGACFPIIVALMLFLTSVIYYII